MSKEINVPLLAEICEAPGAPGFEQKVREIVLREIEGLVDEVSIDNLGNVIAVKKGKEDKRVMPLNNIRLFPSLILQVERGDLEKRQNGPFFLLLLFLIIPKSSLF